MKHSVAPSAMVLVLSALRMLANEQPEIPRPEEPTSDLDLVGSAGTPLNRGIRVASKVAHPHGCQVPPQW